MTKNKETPTNAASPTPRAACKNSRETNESAKDCIEAMRPQEATHMETVRTVGFNHEAGSDSGVGIETAYDRYVG